MLLNTPGLKVSCIITIPYSMDQNLPSIFAFIG